MTVKHLHRPDLLRHSIPLNPQGSVLCVNNGNHVYSVLVGLVDLDIGRDKMQKEKRNLWQCFELYIRSDAYFRIFSSFNAYYIFQISHVSLLN